MRDGVAHSEIHAPNGVLQLQLDFHEPVVQYVHSLLHEKNGRKYNTAATPCNDEHCWTISVTGHSLGGGIATVVGSTFGIPVIDCAVSCAIVLSSLIYI